MKDHITSMQVNKMCWGHDDTKLEIHKDWVGYYLWFSDFISKLMTDILSRSSEIDFRWLWMAQNLFDATKPLLEQMLT